LQEKIDRAPDQSQLDYWSGIFGLDSQITPDEVERLSLAVSIARDAAALSETALAKQAQLATTEVDIEALALEDDTELVSQNASNLSSTEAPEDQQAAVIPTPVIQVPVVQAPVADPIVAEVAEQSAAVSAGEPVAVADAPAEQPTISQVAEESLALASESALEASLLSAQSNLIMTSAQYLNQQISLNQAQSLTEES